MLVRSLPMLICTGAISVAHSREGPTVSLEFVRRLFFFFQMSHLMFSPLYFKSTLYKVTSKCATVTDQPLRLYLSHQGLLGLF